MPTVGAADVPGWQIALITVGAAPFAFTVAVLLHGAPMARRLRTTRA